METKQNVVPARTYATPGRAITAVGKLRVSEGRKRNLQFVISKDSHGRYFPVFLDKVTPISQNEMDANRSANLDKDVQARSPRARKTATKRAAKKSTRGPGRPRKSTVH